MAILKYMTGKNILILHIPKTGGNSIQNFFSRLENFNSYSIGHDINSCKTGGQIKLFVNGNYIKDSRIDNLNNFFKITIVRNPYDRIVSHYNFELTTLENHLKIFDIAEKKYNEKLNNLNFSTRKQIFNEVFFDWQSSDKKINSKTLFKYEIIKNKYEFLKSLGFKKWVKLHGSKHKYNYNTFIEKSDYVIKFENIHIDFEKLKVLLDIKTDSTILHLNKSNRKLDYRDYYDEETKEFVYKLFEDDIKLFNYEF